MPKEPLEKEAFLRKIYGGKQFHIYTAYLEQNQQFEGNYDLIVNNISSSLNKSSTQEKHNCSLNLSANTKNYSPLLTRSCTSECMIPKYWATELYNIFANFKPTNSIFRLQNEVMNIEMCNLCTGLPIQNNHPGVCTDKLQFMNNLAIHYQHVRTIVRMVYNVEVLPIFTINYGSMELLFLALTRMIR